MNDLYLIRSIFKDPQRHEAVVDCAGKHRITIVECDRMSLEEGQTLSEEQFEHLLRAETWLSCIQQALTHLDYGDLSKRRMIEKLRRKFDADIASEVADYLEEKGYINDFELAKRYAENYFLVRHYGPLRVKRELYQKGFSLSDIERVLELYADHDYSEVIWDLVLDHFPEANLKDPAVKRKISSWLFRLGYSWDDIGDVLNSF